MICCWGAKGGSGTSVVAAAVALAAARRPSGALLVDLCGDQPVLLGLREPGGPGVADWLVRGAEAPPDALGRLEMPVTDGLQLLPRGSWDGPAPDPSGTQLAVLVSMLRAERRVVVVDVGCPAVPGEGADPPWAVAGSVLAGSAAASVLVVRPCYLALRRAVAVGVRPTGVVVVSEPWRALRAGDVAQAVGAPVLAEVPVDAAVARVVDAGLLTSRLPRSLERSLASLASVVAAASTVAGGAGAAR